MNSWMWWGIALGAMTGAGIAIIVLQIVPSARRSPYRLIAHSVADISPAAYEEVTRQTRFSSPNVFITSAAQSWTKASQKNQVLELDLRRAGGTVTVVEFRARQLTWSAWSTGGGLAAVTLLGFFIPITPAAIVVMPVVFGVVTFLGYR